LFEEERCGSESGDGRYGVLLWSAGGVCVSITGLIKER
jgi:hypothetical protein